MAGPKLKISGGPLSGSSLRPSGTTPAKPVRLKGVNGQAIAAKPAVKAAPAASSAEDESAKAAAAAKKAEEVAAAEAAAKAAEEQAAAEAAAQAEYERQMEEYNRQMEEYNRQMEEFKAAEAAAKAAEEQVAAAEPASEESAPAAAENPAPAVACPKAVTASHVAKPAAAKPAGAKIAVAKPAGVRKMAKPAAKAPVPAEGDEVNEGGPTEAELDARDAYLAALMAASEQQPVWKRWPFWVAVGAVVLMGSICSVVVMQHNAREARIKAHRDYINRMLVRATGINKQGVENLAQAKAKGVDVTCSKKDAKALLEVLVHPDATNEKGAPLYGGNAEGVAQNACLLLGIAAEADDSINTLVFDTLGKNAKTIRPSLFNWMLQRLAISDNKTVQTNLKKLADTVAAKPDWNKKSEVLSYIWNSMGLRVSKTDVPAIMELLASDKTDSQLAKSLAICLDNIIQMSDNPAETAAVGDQIFENLMKLPEKKRKSNLRQLCLTLAKARSAKTLDYYKKELEDTKTWAKGSGLNFISFWGDDSQLDYVLQLRDKAPDDKAKEQVRLVIGTIFAQNRDRSDAQAQKLIDMYYENLDADISQMADLIAKTDEASETYVGDSNPELPKLKEQLKKLQGQKKQKESLINVLGTLNDWPWVTNLLDKYSKDPNADIASLAKKAKEKTKINAFQAQKQKEDYKARNK